MRIASIAFLLLLTACAKPTREITGFEPIVAEFEAYGHVAVEDIIIRFGDTGTAVGLCSKPSGETPVITLNKAFWDASAEVYHRDTLLHELGHCVLNRGHVTDHPSIMNPNTANPADFEVRYTYYMDELFEPIRTVL